MASLPCCHFLDKIFHPERNIHSNQRDNFLYLYSGPWNFWSIFQVIVLATSDQCTYSGNGWHVHFITNVLQGASCLYGQSIPFQGTPITGDRKLLHSAITGQKSSKAGMWVQKIQAHLIGQVSLFFFFFSGPLLHSVGCFICFTYLIGWLRTNESESLFSR